MSPPTSIPTAPWRLTQRSVGSSEVCRGHAPQRSGNSISVYLPPIPNRMGLWATALKPSGRYIGYCGVYPHFSDAGVIPGEGTLAFYLARAHWRQGLATDAGTAFVAFAFAELHLTRLVATVQVGNDASARILQKLGFSWQCFEEGDLRSYNHFELPMHNAQPPHDMAK